jgi:hypothetical protein
LDAIASSLSKTPSPFLRFFLHLDVSHKNQLTSAESFVYLQSVLGLINLTEKYSRVTAKAVNYFEIGPVIVFTSADQCLKFALVYYRFLTYVDWPRIGLPASTHLKFTLHCGHVRAQTSRALDGRSCLYGAPLSLATQLTSIFDSNLTSLPLPSTAVLDSEFAAKFNSTTSPIDVFSHLNSLQSLPASGMRATEHFVAMLALAPPLPDMDGVDFEYSGYRRLYHERADLMAR